MPYGKFKDGGNFCVHKLTTDGDMGERIACHETEEQADAQIAALNISESERSVFVVRAVNAEQGIIEGALMLWGSPGLRDDYGTWADKSNPPNLGLEVLPRMLYEHGADSDVQRATIGKLTKVWVDADGFKFRAELDRAGKWFRKIIDEIKAGLLKVSSASADHLANFDDWGRFQDWLLTEVSLTKAPAEPRMPSVALLRSSKDIQQPAPTGDAPRVRGDVADTKNSNERNKRTRNMDESILKAIDPALMQPLQALVDEWGADVIAAAVAALMGDGDDAEALSEEDVTAAATDPAVMLSKVRAYVEAKAEEKKADDLNAQVTALTEQVKQAELRAQTEPAPTDPLRFAEGSQVSGRIHGMELRKFVGRSGYDLATAYRVMEAFVPKELRHVPGAVKVSPEFFRALAERAFHESEAGNEPAVEAVRSLRYGGGPKTRADVAGSDVTGFGLEWIGTYFDETLWNAIRVTPVFDALRAKGLIERDIPRGSSQTTISIEGADPTWYTVAETANITAAGYPEINIPASKVGTANTTIDTKKVAALAYYSRELEEDSVIDYAREVQRQFEVSGKEQIEYILFNGDTEAAANTNINLIDGTPPTNANYIALDGFLKAPLITNTANSRDAGATFTEADFEILRGYLGTLGIATVDPTRVIYFMDYPTYRAAQNIPSVKTRDVNSAATIENGVLNSIWGIDVMPTARMALANTSGVISATAGNNTRGRLMLMRPDQWYLGWKRQMEMETVRMPLSDTTGVVARMRIGMVYRAVDDAAAVSYNVLV